MNHADALRDQFVERYFLGELKPEETEAFEAHYFECAVCADDVRLTATFQDAAKAVFSERRQAAPEPDRRSIIEAFWAWIPMQGGWAVAGLLLCATVWQSVVRIPALERDMQLAKSPQVVTAAVLRAETRGDEGTISLPSGAPNLLLIFDINNAVSSPSSVAELRGPGDVVVFSSSMQTPSAGTSLHLLVPASALTPGSYTLIVRGQTNDTNSPGESIGTYRFVLQRP